MKDYTKYIDDYISGNLSPELMDEIRERLTIDEELNEEYQILRKSREYLKAKLMLEEIESDPDLAKAEEIVEQFFQETDQSTSSTSKRRNILLFISPLIAASLVGLILLIRAFTGAEFNEKTFHRTYTPVSQELLQLRLVRGEEDRNLHLGIECYLKKDYKCAIKYFSISDQHHFLLGISYLGNEEYSMAKVYLQSYQTTHPDFPDVNWYLALTFLRLKELDEATIYLELLLNSENRYRARAEKLLKKLGRIKKAGRR